MKCGISDFTAVKSDPIEGYSPLGSRAIKGGSREGKGGGGKRQCVGSTDSVRSNIGAKCQVHFMDFLASMISDETELNDKSGILNIALLRVLP